MDYRKYNCVDGYLGQPWAAGAKGPDAFSCWGLLQAQFKQHFDYDLPDFVVENWSNINDFVQVFSDEQESKSNWIAVPTPQQFDAILLGRARLPVHVGMWIGAPDQRDGRILHSIQPQEDGTAGVVAQRVRDMQKQGWNYMRILRHKTLMGA